MTNLAPFVVPVGRHCEPETWTKRPGFRTDEQYAAVAQIVQNPLFGFSCMGKVFEPETAGDVFRGTFAFLWYDTAGKMQSCLVRPEGRVASLGDTKKADFPAVFP